MSDEIEKRRNWEEHVMSRLGPRGGDRSVILQIILFSEILKHFLKII